MEYRMNELVDSGVVELVLRAVHHDVDEDRVHVRDVLR